MSPKYVDDSSLWEVHAALSPGDSQLQTTTTETVQWSSDNLMTVNCDKTKERLVSFSQKVPDTPNIHIDGKIIERVTTAKL